jgi:type VI secretion system secreted protein Hcp
MAWRGSAVRRVAKSRTQARGRQPLVRDFAAVSSGAAVATEEEHVMPIYLKYGAVNGDVTEANHTSWIELNSFQWGVGRGIGSPTGASADREASAPSISEVTVTKAQDVATIGLLTEALQGEGLDATIDFCKTDKGQLEVYLEYVLSNCMISGFSVSSGGDRPNESLSLNFTQVLCKATQMDAKNATGSPSSITYDLSKAAVA